MADKKQDKKNTNDPRFKHLDMKTTDAASSMDFTGLIPANPQTEDAIISYEEIHEFGERPKKVND